jgi:hypothetical protein
MWWLLIIPIISLIILYKIFPHEMTWWEFLIPVFSSILLIIIVNAITDYAMSRDTEYHGGWVVSVVWDEHWTEEYTVTVDDYGTDSKGNRVKTGSHTETRHTYHPDTYGVKDSNGYEISVDLNHYKMLSNKFGNEKIEKPWRSGQSSWGDGRRFTTTWPGTELTFTPCFTSHSYENRVARSHSIFNFREVDPKALGLYEYPEIKDYHFQNSILGWNDPTAELELTKANCRLGAIKQVRIFILVFRNRSIDTAIDQQMYWKNGNKNEIIICIGINNKNQISWVYPVGWDNERLKVDLREDITNAGPEVNMNKIVSITINDVKRAFSRKHFKDFEYIKLEPPTWAKFLCFTIIVLINIGVGFAVVCNDQR